MQKIVDIHPGYRVQARLKNEPLKDLKLCALFKEHGSSNIKALVWIDGRDIREPLAVSHDQFKGSIGKLLPLSSITSIKADYENLFAAIEFSQEFQNSIPQLTYAMLSRNVDGTGSGSSVVNVRNAASFLSNNFNDRARGSLVGFALNVNVVEQGQKFPLSEGAIVYGKSGKPFAIEGDGGYPIYSHFGSLVGFIIGINGAKTLLVSAEQLERDLKIKFLTIQDRRIRRLTFPNAAPAPIAAE